jgi:GDP-D-mannose 3',5'-epimerase
MDGRNFFQRDCTWLTIVIMAFLLGLPVITISSDQKEHGREVERKLQQQYVRKVATARRNEPIEVWGDGEQTRSFLYIDECIEATRRLMESDFLGPVNIGSEEMVSINQLVDTAAKVARKNITKNHIDGPLGVRGRNSNNDLIREKLGWDYSQTLEEGIRKTYKWIQQQIKNQ